MKPEEEALLSELYTQYYVKIYYYVYAYVKDESSANDIVSDVFILACEKFEDIKDHPNKVGWLYAAARNKVKEILYRFYKENLLIDRTAEVEGYSDVSPYVTKELELALEKILTPEEYKCFKRYFVWGYTLQEMAGIEGITKGNMSVRLSRIRKKIKELLQLPL